MSYIDGFVVAVPKDRLAAYEDFSRRAGAVWKEFGALGYFECVADDVPYGELTSFPRAVMAKDDETVVFAWIVYESRAARDSINQKVMSDPRLKEMPQVGVDLERMIYGGFKPFIEL